MKFDYTKICFSLLKDLPERTRKIIEKRFGFQGEKQSLEAIGKSLGITRERVRQIEQCGLAKLQKKAEKNQKLFDYFLKVLKGFGGVKKEEDFLSYLGKKKHHIFFLLYLCPNIKLSPEDKEFYYFFYEKKKNLNKIKKDIKSIVVYLEKKQKLTDLQELEQDFKNSYSISYTELSKKIQKNPEGKLGLNNWLEINPRGVKDKAYLIFNKMGKPLHFAQIASLIEHSPLAQEGEKVYITTVHNELIKDSRFVLVGRGVYALKEWGYEPGVVKDIITNVLKKQGPLDKDGVLKNVLKKRFVQKNTVYLNLQDKKKFLRDQQGRYFVNQVKEA